MTRLERGPEVAAREQVWKKAYQLEHGICSVMCDSVLMAGFFGQEVHLGPLGHASTSQEVGLMEDSRKSPFNSFIGLILPQSQPCSFSMDNNRWVQKKGSEGSGWGACLEEEDTLLFI